MARTCIEARQEAQNERDDWAAVLMWQGAVLTRWPKGPKAKPFPPLEKFRVVDQPKKAMRGIDETDIKSRLRAYQSARKKDSGNGSNRKTRS